LAIAECLLGAGAEARAHWFQDLAKTAQREDWPSSCVAPFQLLSTDESGAIWMQSDLRQRVFAPYLTNTELAALRQSAKDCAELGRKAFAQTNL